MDDLCCNRYYFRRDYARELLPAREWGLDLVHHQLCSITVTHCLRPLQDVLGLAMDHARLLVGKPVDLHLQGWVCVHLELALNNAVIYTLKASQLLCIIEVGTQFYLRLLKYQLTDIEV